MLTSNRSIKNCLFLLITITATTIVSAQDSIRKRSVEITSTFKPTLKGAAKINFNASPANVDTTRPRLQYNVPNQNLNFAYQPGMLNPVPLQVDTMGAWENWNYVKLGYGSLKNPFIETGLSISNGNSAGLNVYGLHTSAKGKIKYQDFKTTGIDVKGFLRTSNNHEWNGGIGGKMEIYNKYGFEPKTLEIRDDSLKVKFNTLSARLNFRNINRTSFGLTYSPEIRFNVFSDRFNNSENNTHIHLPVNKTVGNLFEVAMAVTADVTNYTAGTKNAVSNSYFVFSPSVLYRKSNVNIHAGIKPSWDSEGVKVFPNVMTEFSSVDNQLTVQAGWIGHMRKNSYQYLAGMNPWMWAPERITTSRITELYGGVKGAVTDHFTYGAKIGFDKFTNQPLFINDTNTGSSFIHLIEPSMKAINFTGEVGYNVGEKFSFLTSLKLNRYFDFEVNDKAWGLVPLELRSAMRLQVMRDLYVKGDLYAFNPPWHLTKSGNSRQSKGAMDLSAGLEFAVVKNVKLWAQFNNILNNEYERWHQYPVYGFNFMGGVILSLAQNLK